MFYKRNFNKFSKFKKSTRVLLFGVFLLICYVFGLFTHLFEKNLSELEMNTIDIRSLVPKNVNDIKTVEYVDVNSLNFNYLHSAEKTCTTHQDKSDNELLLVILIKSKLTHFENRNAIRKTWGHIDKNNFIRKVFLIGLPSPEESSSPEIKSNIIELENENRIYGDIVQQDFFDTYYNNTLKTIMGLRWINYYCPNSKFYAFIDDDFYLNPKLLVNYLQNEVTNSMLNSLYAGYVFGNSSPMRHLISKWYVSLNDYPYNKFPPYIAAGFFILSRESAGYFYVASKIIQIFKFDDIYMGILAKKLNINPLHLPSVYFYPPSYSIDFYSKHVIAAHGFTPKRLESTWTQLEQFIKLS